MKQSIPWFIGFLIYLYLMLIAPLTQFAGWFPSLKSDHHVLLAFLWMVTVLFALMLIVLFSFGLVFYLKIANNDDTVYDDPYFLDDEPLD